MATLWFWLLAALLAGYVVFDGYVLGAGILQPWLARGDDQRGTVIATVRPVWDGNQVWLVAAGATLLLAFPRLYAASFSGFYLPLTIVLWLLMLRGLAIELRAKVHDPLWHAAWDAALVFASTLLAALFGGALGNLVRGVPLDRDGRFFTPLWTDFSLTGETGIIDAYTVTVSLTAVAALARHGAIWLWLRTGGDLERRARAAAGRLWWPTLGLVVGLTAFTVRIQDNVAGRFADHRLAVVLPALALAGLLASRNATRPERAFAASALFLAALIASCAFGIYPYVLPSSLDPAAGLTVHDAAAPAAGLAVGLAWWIPGMLLALAYIGFSHRRFAGKVASGD